MRVREVLLDKAPQDMLNAWARNCRVIMVRPQAHYRSKSPRTGEWYDMKRFNDRWTCTCPGYKYTRHCYHLGAVQRRAEREGWAFHAYLEDEIDWSGESDEV